MTAPADFTRAAEEAYPLRRGCGPTAAQKALAEREAFIAGAAHARQVFLDGLDREVLEGKLLNVLCNASNYPRKVQPFILGQDMGPLVAKVADAVLALLPEGNTEAEAITEPTEARAWMRRFHDHVEGEADLWHGYCAKHPQFEEGMCADDPTVRAAVKQHNASYHSEAEASE